MTRVVMRTAANQAKPAGAVLLDWFPNDRSASTIQERIAPLCRAASPRALDLLRIATAVYCTDKIISRSSTADGWTRDLELSIPVSDPAAWGQVSALGEAVDFLSGDRWSFSFRDGDHPIAPAADPIVDRVALFSGGLDSLVGAVDILASDSVVGLVSHNEGAGVTPAVQQALLQRLGDRFEERVVPYNCFLRPAPSNNDQHRPLPRTRERSTRSRSLLFIALGVAIASAHGPAVEVMIPENGFIGINVPLTRARVGSFSTRTTHPYFIDRVRTTLHQAGILNPLVNPYSLSTKGEMLAACSDFGVLSDLAPLSVSCAHPEAGRWAQLAQGNCGYCFPCLIRRAAMHHVGLDDAQAYTFDALTDPQMWGRTKRNRDLKAVIAAVRSGFRPIDVLRNGPVPGNPAAVAETWGRGLSELKVLLTEKGGAEVAAALASGE